MELSEETVASPNGEWTATSLTGFPGKAGGHEYYVRLTVTSVGGGVEWVVVDEWRPTGLGWTSPSPLYWSDDGARFYFTNLPHPDGCALLTNGVDLHRLDLATGVVTELMPESALWVTLSPDERQAAFIGYGDRGLVVRDLATGEERVFPLDLGTQPAQAGAIVWSPDASRLAYTVIYDPCSAVPTPRSVWVLDLASGTMVTVLDHVTGVWLTKDWPEADRLRLSGPEEEKWVAVGD
jgi:hypothetical protein